MKNKFTYGRYHALALLFIAGLTLAGCKKKDDPDPTPAGPTTTKIDETVPTTGTAVGSAEIGANTDDLIAGSTFPSTVTINFGATTTITNGISGVTITQTGGDVVIKSTATGVGFVVTGTTADGSVKIYSDKKFSLTLNNANITNSDGPAINIQSSKRAFIVLTDGSTNTLTDGAVYTPTAGEDQKGTFFTEGQVIFSGTGSLTVKGNNKHGIVSDDYIRVIAGTITVTGSVSDGIHTNSAFIMDGGTVNITSGSDGIETEKGYMIFNAGTVTINAAGKGVKASYEDSDPAIIPYININGGTITVSSTGDEGISSKNALTVNKGDITVKASDDAFSAETAININGGNILASSTANDGVDSNGPFTITGGKLIAVTASSTESSIDCGTGIFKITGGSLVGIGGATSLPTAASSTINSVVLGAGTAQIIHLEAADGTEALTYQAPSAYGTLVFASSKLKAAATYSIYTGGSVASGVSFNGLYSSGVYTRGTKSSTTFTTASIVTQAGGTIGK